jgi:predicted acyl esterase
VSNSVEALEYQLLFFNKFLANKGDGPPSRVRLETRRTLEEYSVRADDEFPSSATTLTSFYLDAESKRLVSSMPTDSSASYDSESDVDCLRFSMRFDEDTEISGPMALRCFMSAEAGFDLDLFVGVRKIDSSGQEVHFWNRLSSSEIVTRGWLRASRRPDPSVVADSLVPIFDGDVESEFSPHEVMEMNVEILPSSTFYEKGSSMVLELRGRDITELQNFQHHHVFNSGRHTLWCGTGFPSRLLLPLQK